ncbi:unnamed protein product, partial [Medioppia subpectinata]
SYESYNEQDFSHFPIRHSNHYSTHNNNDCGPILQMDASNIANAMSSAIDIHADNVIHTMIPSNNEENKYEFGVMDDMEPYREYGNSFDNNIFMDDMEPYREYGNSFDNNILILTQPYKSDNCGNHWVEYSYNTPHEYYDENSYNGYNYVNYEERQNEWPIVPKNESQEMSDASSEAIYLDNLEISDARDILDLETPIKTSKEIIIPNNETVWPLNTHNISDNILDESQQNADSTQSDEYIVTSLDDLQPIDKEDNQQIACNLDDWTHIQNNDSIFNTNITQEVVFETSAQPMMISEYHMYSQELDNC